MDRATPSHLVYLDRRSSSIGVSLFPQDSEQAEKLINYADKAMYLAKQQGKNKICFFSRSQQEALERRQTVELELRQALSQGDLQIYYQPQFCNSSEKVVAEGIENEEQQAPRCANRVTTSARVSTRLNRCLRTRSVNFWQRELRIRGQCLSQCGYECERFPYVISPPFKPRLAHREPAQQ